MNKQTCTCTGSCRGADGLGEGWVCALTLPAPYITDDPDRVALDIIKEREELRKQLANMEALNDDKFRTIAAYTRVASVDKWKIGRLIEAIDQFLSANGHSEHSKLLTEARADVINCKTGMFPDQPLQTQWNPK